MIPKIIAFDVPPNAMMLKACVSPQGCPRCVSMLRELNGEVFQFVYCPVWSVSKYGKKITYGCGMTQMVAQPPEQEQNHASA